MSMWKYRLKIPPPTVNFTDSDLWAGLIIELPCPFVGRCVTKVVIVNNVQSIIFFLSLFIK